MPVGMLLCMGHTSHLQPALAGTGINQVKSNFSVVLPAIQVRADGHARVHKSRLVAVGVCGDAERGHLWPALAVAPPVLAVYPHPAGPIGSLVVCSGWASWTGGQVGNRASTVFQRPLKSLAWKRAAITPRLSSHGPAVIYRARFSCAVTTRCLQVLDRVCRVRCFRT